MSEHKINAVNTQGSVINLIEQLHTGKTTAKDIVEKAIAQTANAGDEGKKVFTQFYPEWATQLAELSDKTRALNMSRSLIDGVTISIKDLFDVAGEATTAGSVVLKSAAPADKHAEVVQRLLSAGAVVVGKTNMTEFAYSGLGINPHYGTPANPAFAGEARIPGGSSSGAAVSVGLGMAAAAIGSDTGGSIRIPAAFCGLTGFKPTASRVSRQGVLPLSEALDSIGVIAHDVASCAVVDGIISGQPLTLAKRDIKNALFAIPTSVVFDGIDETVKAAFEHTIALLEKAGATIERIALEEFKEVAQINAKGGYNAAEAWTWHAKLLAEKENEYDQRVASRIHKGEAMSASDFIELAGLRASWQARVTAKIQGYDALLLPTVPTIAPRIADLVADEDLYFATNGKTLRNPTFINFLDGCALSVPCQQPGTAPVGLMIAGGHMQDEKVLQWAYAIEKVIAAGYGKETVVSETERQLLSDIRY